ncbi:glycosyltransferase family 4 protein [Neobacillus vireti]|uniref:glycosyltransferase family 4 protein n=1 Tax=Neobacillus vireti TaxID=220686 RepID=UPI002FFEA597
MKIAVFINNINIKDVDCSCMRKGNPGIGGTEYCFLLLCEMYKMYYPQDEITILATSEGKLPNVDSIEVVGGIQNVVEVCKSIHADILVISAVDEGNPLPDVLLNEIERNLQKTVIWGHNFYLSDFATKLAKNKYIRANVFVGKQQYDRYLDHSLIYKSTYIFNMYPKSLTFPRQYNDSKTVTYIGSLVYHKGFHLLAKSWKEIIKAVPGAQLYVIGTGKLYSRESKLGPYGIAAEDYERLFIKGLTDERGKLLDSVHFLGILGAEKNDIIAQTSVGVVNPSGRTETFGLSALDFESHGVPVVTIGNGGFLDTVVDEYTGLLYSNVKDLPKKIIYLLENAKVNQKYGENGKLFYGKFLPERLIGQWHDLFETVINDSKLEVQIPNDFYKGQLKRLRLANYKLKSALKIQWLPSVITIETIAKKIIRKVKK